MARAGRLDASERRHRPRRSLQNHLFVRHDRRAQRHRATAPHALRTVRPHFLQRRSDHRLDALIFKHDAGRFLSDAGAGRNRGPHVEIRRRRIPSPLGGAPRHPCDARSGAISPDHGARGFRAIRSLKLCPETLDQRTLHGRAEGRHSQALARRPGRILRHDRRRRLSPPINSRTSCTPSASRCRATTSA